MLATPNLGNKPSDFLAVVYSGSATGVTVGGNDITYTLASPLTLDRDTRHYVAAGWSTINNLFWGRAKSPGAAGSGYSAEFYSDANSSGTNWISAESSSSTPMIMKINAVPEPSMVAGLSLAAAAAMALRRRDRPRGG